MVDANTSYVVALCEWGRKRHEVSLSHACTCLVHDDAVSQVGIAAYNIRGGTELRLYQFADNPVKRGHARVRAR